MQIVILCVISKGDLHANYLAAFVLLAFLLRVLGLVLPTFNPLIVVLPALSWEMLHFYVKVQAHNGNVEIALAYVIHTKAFFLHDHSGSRVYVHSF